MNPQLKEINEIISICNDMSVYIDKFGNISPGNPTYENYKSQIALFLKKQGLKRGDYGPFEVLNMFWSNNRSFSLNSNEMSIIRKTIIDIKHDLFPDCFEKIFISHREKNKAQVSAFMELLYAIGIPRPNSESSENTIFCTSHPAVYLENGSRNLDTIKKQFTDHMHTYCILWYTDDYFESQACLNEAGAIWATGKRYQEILSPKFDSKKIGGLLDKQQVWFKADDKYRLNSFKEQIEQMFGLTPISANAWETARDSFIEQIRTILEKAQENAK